MEEKAIFEVESDSDIPDPEEVPIRDRKVFTQPYDLAVESLVDQIKGGTIFLRPLSERPNFQRRYVWTDVFASRLIESIILNVPIPPCYLSQNEDFELDVIDGQQRLFSLYRFLSNQFPLSGLEILKELNGSRFFEINQKIQRQVRTHTLRCVLITNESHPEIKFDVFERLNSNTAPLNSQELRNCIYRGALNSLVKDLAETKVWLDILAKKEPDKRMRDEELILRFFAFLTSGVDGYRTPQKHWLNSVAKNGMKYSPNTIKELNDVWDRAIFNSLIWFPPRECFRRHGSKVINRALFDLISQTAAKIPPEYAAEIRPIFLERYDSLLQNADFQDLISRAVDHTSRTKRRFELWSQAFSGVF
ncbi:DUF262 domain-containing protein [Chromobacterium violaceum]|uniref:DUF262 domain-containing protein n=1 Tax=Chromobacterium violaceum TaxID=536 RepID=UPI0009BA229F|nr:DUF262 domain-containing protein [Chromobacterium violaceum]